MNSCLEQSRGSRICLVVAYDGTDFHGFARQSGLRTVQGVLEDHLTKMLNCDLTVEGSGRTDKGVHARAQVVHWDQPYGPPAENYVYVLRRYLPADVIPLRATEVDSAFHARFSVRRKTYRYRIDRSFLQSVFDYRFAWHLHTDLDIAKMRKASRYLVGEHDFTSFCAASAPQENKVRRISRIDISESGAMLVVDVEGTGFLQYMVRIIVGTLVDVAIGRLSEDTIPAILRAKSRPSAGQTAPPHGLCLWRVEYPAHYVHCTLDLDEYM